MNFDPQARVTIPLPDKDVGAAFERLCSILETSTHLFFDGEFDGVFLVKDKGGTLVNATEYEIKVRLASSGVVADITARSTGFGLGDPFKIYRRKAQRLGDLLVGSGDLAWSASETNLPAPGKADHSSVPLVFLVVSVGFGLVAGILGRLPLDLLPYLLVLSVLMFGVVRLRSWLVNSRQSTDHPREGR